MEEAFRLTKKLAQGGGGMVYLGDAFDPDLQKMGSQIIVKVVGFQMNASLSSLPLRNQGQFKQEVSIMFYLREEKHIAKLLGWSDTPACLIMKYYPRGSLDKWIDSKSTVKTKRLVLRFLQNISSGLMAMHNAGFAHCDLKPQNVLLDEDETGLFCCLTDFGITQIVDETTLLVKDFEVTSINGLSIHYAAPELFARFRSAIRASDVPGEIVIKVDLYALSIVMFELLEFHTAW
jgi:serine/threonine protein kinase